MHNDLYPDMVIGCLKARTVPVNVNYHYTPREVAELLDYLRAARRDLSPVASGRSSPTCCPPPAADLLISVDDGSDGAALPGAVKLEDALAQGDPDADIAPSPDDVMMYCTGGTTGRPKGVLWRQSDTYVSSMVGADHESVDEIHDKVRARRAQPWFAVSPLMHAAGMWTVFSAVCSPGCPWSLRRPDEVRPARGAARPPSGRRSA